MRDISYFSKILLAIDPVDFRKHAHGLASIVENALQYRPIEGRYLFVFTNRRKTAVKLLYWDTTGYALWWKTLEKDRFRWPRVGNKVMVIKARELKWLLEGIDFSNIKTHKEVKIG